MDPSKKRSKFSRKTPRTAGSSSSSSDSNNGDGNERPGRSSERRRPKRRHQEESSSSESDESNPSSSGSSSNTDANDNRGILDEFMNRLVEGYYRPGTSDDGNSFLPLHVRIVSEGILPDSDDSDSSSDSKLEEKLEKEELPLTFLHKSKLHKPNNFSVVDQVMKRQIGHDVRFDRKLYGSVNMVERLTFYRSLQKHQGCVNTVEFNQEGDLLVSGSDDLQIILWDWGRGKKIHSFHSGHRNNVFQVSWMPYEKSKMVSCASDGQVRLQDMNKESSHKMGFHKGSCNKLATHPACPHIVFSVGDDCRVLSMDTRDFKVTELLTGMENKDVMKLLTIHSNPCNENELCVGGSSSFVRIYDRRKTDTEIMKFRPRKLTELAHVCVTSATYNHDGTEVLASYNDNNIFLFDVTPSRPSEYYDVHMYQGHRNFRTIKGVNFFGPKSEFIVSGSDCGHIYFWEKNSEVMVHSMYGDALGVVNCIKPHPFVPVLASSGLDYDVKVWVPSTRETFSIKELYQRVKGNLTDRGMERYPGGAPFVSISEFLSRMKLSYTYIRAISTDEDESD